MTNFMGRWIGKNKGDSAQSAKERLKFVLVADRTTLSPEELRNLQAEILEVLRKYARIEDEDINLTFEQRDRGSHLVADIPIKPQHAGERGGNIHIETSLVPADDEEGEEPEIDAELAALVNGELEPETDATTIAIPPPEPPDPAPDVEDPPKPSDD